MAQIPIDIVKELIIVSTAVMPKPNFDFTCLIFAEINVGHVRTGIVYKMYF